jgi:hypothetical protein
MSELPSSAWNEREKTLIATKRRRQQVYFAITRDRSLIKIGTSKNPIKRVEQQREYGPLEIIGTIDGGLSKERHVQSSFSQHRKRGEWFHVAPELLEGISVILGKQINISDPLDGHGGEDPDTRRVTIHVRVLPALFRCIANMAVAQERSFSFIAERLLREAALGEANNIRYVAETERCAKIAENYLGGTPEGCDIARLVRGEDNS